VPWRSVDVASGAFAESMSTPTLSSACLALLAACGPAARPLSPEAARVTLSDKAPPEGYERLTLISAQSGKGCGVTGSRGSREDAEAKLRAEAERVGATYVQLTEQSGPKPNHQCLEHEHKLGGIGYRKPNAAPAPVPTAARVATLGVVQDYEPGAPPSKPAEATAVSRVNVTLAAGDPSGNALAVDYGCSGAEQRALLDVWSLPRTSDWSKARALSFRIKPEGALVLSVSFLDGNHAGYTQKTQPLTAGSWQTVTLPFDKFWLNPFGPQGDTPGAPQDLSRVGSFGFAPDGCGNGRFLIDDFSLSP
jgi:hypothetical protein